MLSAVLKSLIWSAELEAMYQDKKPLLEAMDKRAEFTRQIDVHLGESGVKLQSLSPGRNPNGVVWVLCVALPRGSLLTFHVPVVGEPMAPELPKKIADAVLGYLRDHDLLGTT